MIILDKKQENRLFRIVITPNRSFNWPMLVRFYILTCFISLGIACGFAALGYWIVLPFAGLEMLVFGGGMYLACRRIYRQEVITLDGDSMLLEKGCSKIEQTWQFDPNWVRLERQERPGYRAGFSLFVGSHGQFVEIGEFLNHDEKEALEFELNEGILAHGFFRRSEQIAQ